MLEILGLILLCRVNKKNALAAGKGGGAAIGLTVGLWVGLEIIGAMIGAAADLGMGSYALAIIFGIAGGVASYFISKAPSSKAQGGAWQNTPPGQSIPQAPRAQGNPSFCTNCGCNLAQGVKFCPSCGTNVSAGQAPPPPVPAPAPAPALVPAAAPAAIRRNDVFYAFAVQGPAFGADSGGDPVMEKAQKLKSDYSPARNMELRVVRPHMWGGRVQDNSSAGIISVSYNFGEFKSEIGKYLKNEGIAEDIVENGLRLCDENSLQLTNPMSGLFVMGVPIMFEPAAPPHPQPVTCPHDYRHFTCALCGEKAPKPQLATSGQRVQGQYTYEEYRASTAEEAKYFLELTSVSLPFYYVMVDTPQGEWGKDKDGLFLSKLCSFQRELSLRECDAGTALTPERMHDMQMAANGIADNYLLSVTCGSCGYNWVDGVGYRTKTIVICPECGKHNLADTEGIRFNDI